MDYNVLRKIVVNCVEGRCDDDFFKLNTFKLNKKVSGLGLVPVVFKHEYKSKRVGPEDIVLLAEYFKEEKLIWFDNSKTFLTIVFVREEDMDDELRSLLADCSQAMENEIDPPEKCEVDQKKVCKEICKTCPRRKIDLSATLSKIIGTYPCYSTVVARWVKPDSITISVRFRANSILINGTQTEPEEPVTK